MLLTGREDRQASEARCAGGMRQAAQNPAYRSARYQFRVYNSRLAPTRELQATSSPQIMRF